MSEDIPEPFDALDTIEEPSDAQRAAARDVFPDRAVPEEGPVPSPPNFLVVEPTIEVPRWLLAVVMEDLDLDLSDPPTEAQIQAEVQKHIFYEPELVTPDGMTLTKLFGIDE